MPHKLLYYCKHVSIYFQARKNNENIYVKNELVLKYAFDDISSLVSY